MTLELRSNSGLAEALPGYQVANEATSPGSTFQVGSTYIGNDGITYGTSFTDISADLVDQQLVRFGVFVRNQSGDHTELVLATLRVEIQSRS